jgi:hypothetical protein
MKLSPGLLLNSERLECKLEGGVMKMAKLRKILTHPGKNESGQGILAIVLLFLMLGAVILTPLLVFMQTGVKSGQVYESKLQEFYAADSGVEAAICEISQNDTALIVPDYSLNDRNVNVTIREIVEGGYKINSTATSDDGGSTTIECYVLNIPSFLNLFDNAITSNGTVCTKGAVNGTIVAENCTQPGCDNPNCTELDKLEDPIIWPSELQISTYYWRQVKDLTPDLNSSIDAGYTDIIGPLYRDGTLLIFNTGEKDKIVTLNGTVYVTDDPSTHPDLIIGGINKDFTLNLNNQTIYCEGSVDVGGKCTITGSGCIIAVGDIDFHPNIPAGSESNFVFIMSVEGEVLLHPNGDYYGAVVGNVDVSLLSGTGSLTWTSPGEGGGNINFPTETVGELIVLSYTLK